MTDANANHDPAAQRGVIPHLIIDGAAKAADFYIKAFGATDLMRMPAEDGVRLMHCYLVVNGGGLMLMDPFPESGDAVQAPAGYLLHLNVDDVQAWWDRAVAAGCEVSMPLADQFWGDRYGHLKDPFGITWSLASPSKP